MADWLEMARQIETAQLGVALMAVTLVMMLVLFLREGALSRRLSRLEALTAATRDALVPLPDRLRDEARRDRDELQDALGRLERTLDGRLAASGARLAQDLGHMRAEAGQGRSELAAQLRLNAETLADVQSRRLGEMSEVFRQIGGQLDKALAESRQQLQQGLERMAAGLDQLRRDNEGKLEQMRATVEEKLQGTLEARLGASFRQVSERLEQVHKGLGEMQNLAAGVGDLKRVLTNVKSRGGWGEVQLGLLLDDLLTAEQVSRNVRIRPDSGEIVEFAVRLPGKDEDRPLFLPIDAKFPQEDYERLMAAEEAGDPAEAERAAAALERAIRLQARTVAEKYVHPPYSTDFAILYLPTEGLYAEVIRRPGLAAEIQRDHRILLTGPTTLTALLTSLQMGFRTLAIEKRSSEVWQVLAAAKAEFRKYGQIWDKLGKQLQTAQNTVSEAGRRTRVIERQLRDVETLEAGGVALETLLTAGGPESADAEDGEEV